MDEATKTDLAELFKRVDEVWSAIHRLSDRIDMGDEANRANIERMDRIEQRISLHSDLHNATSNALKSVRDFISAANDTFAFMGFNDMPFIAGEPPVALAPPIDDGPEDNYGGF